jgi:hypothetical protein
MRIIVKDTAADIPDEWDLIANDNMFLLKSSLLVIEKSNPCSQRYYLFYSHCDELDSIMVTYRLRINIFTYGVLDLKIPVTIVGIPASVSSQGIVIGKNTDKLVQNHIESIKGGKLILNVNEGYRFGGFAVGRTLPSHLLEVRWKSYDEYLDSLRSHYRYRFKKAMAKRSMLFISQLESSSQFDESLYQLYLNVYNRSQYKLEKLGIEFFKSFQSIIIKFEAEGKAIGFVQLAKHDKNLIFLFGGMDYDKIIKYDLYYNMLLKIIEIGINEGCSSIELGQTAEDTKQKLGGNKVPKNMFVSHSNGPIKWILSKSIGLLSYKSKDIDLNVFKDKTF